MRVEGDDDKHVICNLTKKHGLASEGSPSSFAYPNIKEAGGLDKLLKGVGTAVRLGTGKRIGFVLDANGDLPARWRSISQKLIRVGVEVPPEIPKGGFVGHSSKYDTRVGVWIMPDNRRSGALEDFLQDLVSANDQLLLHARESTDAARALGARFPESQTAKAVLHAWLAWQKRPGRPYGIGVTKGYFQHDQPAAQRFVDWFRRLFFASQAI